MCITQKRALLYDYHDDARHGSCLLAMHGQPLDGFPLFFGSLIRIIQWPVSCFIEKSTDKEALG